MGGREPPIGFYRDVLRFFSGAVLARAGVCVFFDFSSRFGVFFAFRGSAGRIFCVLCGVFAFWAKIFISCFDKCFFVRHFLSQPCQNADDNQICDDKRAKFRAKGVDLHTKFNQNLDSFFCDKRLNKCDFSVF